jgi:hypothetical protein
MVWYADDIQYLDDIRSLLQQKRYSEVVVLAGKIQYPELITDNCRWTEHRRQMSCIVQISTKGWSTDWILNAIQNPDPDSRCYIP